MKVWTLWAEPEDEGFSPWLLGAYDGVTGDAHMGEPEFYTNLKRANPTAREMILILPPGTLSKLFEVPEHVVMKVEDPEKETN